MFSEFFGHYLLNKGIITADELSTVLSAKDNVRLKIGVLAINDGVMTSEQVTEIHELQKSTDKYFGELAIEKGYINSEILESLLKKQKLEHLILAQALADENLMTMKEFEEEINLYKKKNDLSDEAFEQLKDNKSILLLDNYLTFNNIEHSNFYKDYVKLFFKNIIRFIDTSIRIASVEVYDEKTYDVYATQYLEKENQYITGIAGDKDVLIKLAGIYAEETFKSLDDYSKDSLGEFLNLNNGLFLVNMSNQNIPMNMSVQEVHEQQVINTFGKIFVVPFFTSFGKFDLIIGKQ